MGIAYFLYFFEGYFLVLNLGLVLSFQSIAFADFVVDFDAEITPEYTVLFTFTLFWGEFALDQLQGLVERINGSFQLLIFS